ncbi:MAG: metal-dependent hydrolase [Bacillota bacterium]
MTGKTHLQIGVLSYALVSTIPIFSSQTNIDQPNGLSIAGMIVAAAAALLPDADCYNSKINHMNPVMETASGVVDFIRKIIVTILNLLFTLGVGTLILLYRNPIIQALSKLEYTKDYPIPITYGTAALFFFLGFAGRKGVSFLRVIPIVGNLYNIILKMIYRGGNFLKKTLIKMIYVLSGLWLMWYNYMYIHDPYLYMIGVLFIFTGIFPHRTFLHALEGFMMFQLAFGYVAGKLGYENLKLAFFIGYFSHLYLTDLLTKQGVPLSAIPLLLHKLGIRKKLKKYKWYRAMDKVLSVRLKLPIMSTGTTWGNLFEGCYTLIFFIAFAVYFVKSKSNIVIM